VNFRGLIPVAALGLLLSVGTSAFAASATDYNAIRSKASVTTLGSTDQIISQFPARSGQTIEVEGIVNGVFTSQGETGFLLQIDPNQTIIVTSPKPDQDIAIGSRLRVLARIPAAGSVLEAQTLTRVDQLTPNASGAGVLVQPGTSTQSNGNLNPPTDMPVAQRPPVIYYKGTPRNDAGIPYGSGMGLAQQPAVVQRYAQKIKAYNCNVPDDLSMKIAFCILDKSERYGVDPRLTMALVAQESRFNPNAVSRTGAEGLGQLMPGTASILGVRNAFDVEDNLDGSVRYLAEQLQTFGGRVSLALAAYNAGPGNVKRFGGVPPFNETQNYVKVIWQNYTGMIGEMVN